MTIKLFGASVIAVALSCMSMAENEQERVRCRTLRPNSAAFAERVALARAPKTSSSRMRAAINAETRLDVIDVLVAYDLSAQSWLVENNKGTPLEYARKKVDEMNRCLANSCLDEFTFRLVGTVSIGVDATQYRDFRGDVDFHGILSRCLVNNDGLVTATGEWTKITDQREELGADVVSVLVASGLDGVIGLGYSLEDDMWSGADKSASIVAFGDWAYSVCSIEAADVGNSMLHEIGHNMGCGHADATCASPNAMELGPQFYSYSAGYYFWIGEEGYCTIMGYNFGGLRSDGSYFAYDRFTELPYFSSPLLTYRGVPIGTSHNDNRQTLLNTYACVAQYRVSRSSSTEETVDHPEPVPYVFATEFRPLKAVNGTAPYVGAIYDGDKVVGTLALKCGKVGKSGRLAGKSKVSAVVTGLDGKQKSSKAVDVDCGYDVRANLVVTGWGALSLTLGGEGFVGTLGNGFVVKTASVGGAWPHPQAAVDVDFDAGTGGLPAGTLDNLLPAGGNAEPFSLVSGKWKFAPAAVIKYKKVTDPLTQETSYVLQGVSDPLKTNHSAMKLVYTPKKGTFTGSFKVYVLESPDSKPRLRTLSAKVTGVVVDCVGYGRAEIKKIGTYPVSVRPTE